MPSSACEPMLGSLEDKLKTLKLANPGDSARLDRVMAILGDLIGSCPAPSSMIESGVDECTLWEIFASVFETEVATQQGRRKKLSLQDRRQILADILVWAEVTQAHYDPCVFSFVMSPHNGDQSFQRIGTMLAKARAAAGLTTRSFQDSSASTTSGTSPLSVSVSSELSS